LDFLIRQWSLGIDEVRVIAGIAEMLKDNLISSYALYKKLNVSNDPLNKLDINDID
jgi:hypothetical protein